MVCDAQLAAGGTVQRVGGICGYSPGICQWGGLSEVRNAHGGWRNCPEEFSGDGTLQEELSVEKVRGATVWGLSGEMSMGGDVRGS